MQDSNRFIRSGDIYFVNHAQDAKTQEEYQNRLATEEHIPVWQGRPGVVVSDESENSVPGGGVLVSFITRRAHNPDIWYYDLRRNKRYWYKELSPSQLDITLGGRPATVLTIRAYWVSKSDLGKWMGRVSENELREIAGNVRLSGTMTPEGEALLYRPAGLEAGLTR